MSREIKFRAWDNNQNKMRYSWDKECLLSREFTAFMFGFEREYPNDFNFTQFTGLKDKNGKEIYEGDIIQTEGLNKGSVEMGNYETDYPGSWIIKTKRHDESKGYLLISDYVEEEGKYTKILGNIYEDKGLKPSQREE